jgi:hypothetical protein
VDTTPAQPPVSRTVAANTRAASRTQAAPPRDTIPAAPREAVRRPNADSARQAAQLAAAQSAPANVVVPPPVPQPTGQTAAVTPQLAAPILAETTVARPPAPPPVENHAPAITAAVTAYARAIGTRNVAEVRRAYPGMTTAQQSAWESFFGSVRSMTATFDVSNLEVNGTTAIARLTGEYEFVNRSGRTERQPANFTANFQRDGEVWRLMGIR